MYKFYKIDNGILVSGSGISSPDDTWLTDWSKLETKEDGSYAIYYNEDMTIDIDKETEVTKTEAIAKANSDYESEVAKLTAGVPDSERSTWTKQESEARAYQADNTAVTPFIDSLSESRGVDKDYLVQKIIEKSDAYAIAIGTLTGVRQKAEDSIG